MTLPQNIFGLCVLNTHKSRWGLSVLRERDQIKVKKSKFGKFNLENDVICDAHNMDNDCIKFNSPFLFFVCQVFAQVLSVVYFQTIQHPVAESDSSNVSSAISYALSGLQTLPD
jgi:hypothetical protein